GQAGIAAAPLQVIDAEVARNARAGGKLAFDAAGRRHRQLIGEQDGANLRIAIGPAGSAQQPRILLSRAKIRGICETASPEAAAILAGLGFIIPEFGLAERA